MTYDVYFHNDFDGRASAAVMLAFLRSRGDDIEHFVPVNYYLLSQWLDEDFFRKHKLFKGKRNPPIVVDFLYHPKAAWWFEHHPTTFKKEVWKKGFKPDKQHRLEPRYPSCTHLVSAALKKDFSWQPPRHMAELVKWLDIIDGANYRSARQTIEAKESALQVDKFIESKSLDKKENGRIVDLLSRFSLADIARRPEVTKAVGKIKKKDLQGIAFSKKHARMAGIVCFMDRTSTKLEFPHFALQYLFPRKLYFVRMSHRDGLYHVNVGANPWMRKKGKVHVGELLQRFGGGGHKDVGGVEFKTKKESLDAVKTIIETINRSSHHAS